MTTYTSKSLPLIEAADKIAAPANNLRLDINDLSEATDRALLQTDAVIDGQNTRLTAVEVLGGLAPGDVNDTTSASLISNPGTQTKAALNAAYATLDANGRQPVRKDEIFTNVRDYGVVLDGSAATGPQLVNAISAANILGLPLRLPKGRYAFDQVNIPSGTTIEGSGPGTVILQSVAAQPALMALGSNEALGALASELAKGATVINITQTWGLVAGDLIMVLDSFSYAVTDAGYKSGEMLEVASSTGTAITLTSPVRGSFSNASGSYTVANGATIRKINPVKNVAIRNMAFQGHASGTSNILKFQNVDGLTLEGVSTISAQAGFCMFDMCRNVDVSKFGLHGLVDNWATGYPGYGFIIRHACDNVRISDGVSTKARHAITTLGGPYGVPRNLVFGPNIISSDASSTAGIDTHSAGEGILIHGNIIENSYIGITSRARNITIRDNDIRGTTNNGVLVSEDSRDVLIEGNRLAGCAIYGIRVGASNTGHINVSVRNNVITETAGDAISAGPGHTDLRISLNSIIRANGKGIDVHAGSTDVRIHRNEIQDASLVGNFPGINVVGSQVAGLFDITQNTVTQKTAKMNRAVYTTRTGGRATGNRAYGPFASSGSEFSVGAGFTNGDNVLYA